MQTAEMLFLNIQSDGTFYHPNPDEKVMVNRCSFLKKLMTMIINDMLKPYVEPDDAYVRNIVAHLLRFFRRNECSFCVHYFST